MALEAFVLSPRRLASFDEWQAAVDQEKWPLKFTYNGHFSELKGFLPVDWKGRKTGFECDHWKREDINELLLGHSVSDAMEFVLAFRWARDFYESVAVAQASAAYALATGGVLFDCEEGKIKSANEAAEMARQIDAFLPEIEAALNKKESPSRQ